MAIGGVYANQLGVTQTTWGEMLKKLHGLGADSWDILFGTRSSDQKGASEAAGDLLAHLELSSGTHIQVSYAKGLKDFIFPWSILHPMRVSGVVVDPFQFWGLSDRTSQGRPKRKQPG